MSFANYLIDFGLVYRENGEETNPYKSVKAHGANIVRLQLDRVAFNEINGVTIDWQQWERVLEDAKHAKAEGHGLGIYTYPAAWGYGSTWENNSYWDFTNGNNLHEGIDWMQDIE